MTNSKRSNAQSRIATEMPCDCGSTNAYWHGNEFGLRVYACNKCWRKARATYATKHLVLD